MTRLLKRGKRGIRTLALLMSCLMLLCSFSGCVVDDDGEDDRKPPTGEELPVGGDGVDTRPRVALTFDDGPNHYQDRTKNVVDELCKYGYSATFFVVGNRVAGGDSVAYAIEKGMEIGIHGYTHEVYYNNCTAEAFEREMNDTIDAVRAQVPGWTPRLMRPIGGAISEEIAGICPYPIILWSVDSDDWNHKYNSSDTDKTAADKVNAIVDNVLSQLEDGDIILMHDIYESTYDATVVLLARLYEMGYNVVSVSELLGDDLAAGQKYYRE